MLELCMLQSKFINPRDSVPEIQETLQNIHREASKRYSHSLLNIVFGLLSSDPTKRLQVSAVKAKLENSFKHLLTEEVKASLGLQNQSSQGNSGVSNTSYEVFTERTNQILKEFESDKKAKETKLNDFQESINKLQERLRTFNFEVDKIKSQVSRKYENTIQDLKQENLDLIEKLRNDPQYIDEKRVPLNLASRELNSKWDQGFSLHKQLSLSVYRKYEEPIDDQSLQDFAQGMVREYSKEDLWKDLNQLEISMNG